MEPHALVLGTVATLPLGARLIPARLALSVAGNFACRIVILLGALCLAACSVEDRMRPPPPSKIAFERTASGWTMRDEADPRLFLGEPSPGTKVFEGFVDVVRMPFNALGLMLAVAGSGL